MATTLYTTCLQIGYLIRTTPTALSLGRHNFSATTVGDYALFGGGTYSDGSQSRLSAVVDAYDGNLTRSLPNGFSVERQLAVAITVGDYALFCGGTISTSYTSDTTESNYSAVVDAYAV